MIELDGDGMDNPTGETVLDALNAGRVLFVSTTDDGRFRFCERCDDYYVNILTKKQVLLLADELRALAESSNASLS